MTQHSCADPTADHHAGLADLLDSEAEALGQHLDDMADWIERHAPRLVRTVVDLGSGTGTGTLRLARRFPTAEVIAVDKSPFLLQRVRTAATRQEVANRVRALQADLDTGWPATGTVDLVVAVSSLHEVADPGRVLRNIHAALDPGGVVVVVEMDDLPRFLPEDIGKGNPGLETRCHAALAHANWNSHPDWRPHLERAGFAVLEQRRFDIEVGPESPGTGRYAHTYLRHVRSALDGRLGADDLDALDHLLAEESPDAVDHRHDLILRGSRTAWAARRD